MIVVSLILVVFTIGDVFCYASIPFEFRSNHCWAFPCETKEQK